jgi:dTMP kinase
VIPGLGDNDQPALPPLIVFEGGEGVGKSTQIRLLAEYLAESAVPGVALREPGGTPLGEELRRVVLSPDHEISPRAEALLFMAARAQLIKRIQLERREGRVVLLDRFFLSTYAYQVSGRGLAEEDIAMINDFATGGLKPDVTLLLTLPVKQGLARVDARGARDRMESAGDDFHERVAEAFHDFTERVWKRHDPVFGDVLKVDATGAAEEVFARVLDKLRHFLPETFDRGSGSTN